MKLPRPVTKRTLAADARRYLMRLSRLAANIRRSPYFEDRLEYHPEDLASSYGLSAPSAAILHAMLHNIE